MLNNLTQVMWRLSSMEITDAQRDAAIKATTELLVAIDIKRVDELRQRLKLPPECLGFVAEIYAAILAAPHGEYRELLPMTSEGKLVNPNDRVTILGKPKIPFRPERLYVSGASTEAGTADWIVNDVRMDGKTVFLQPGDIPGDMFAASAIDSFVAWGECSKGMEIDVTYIGKNPDGCAFYGSFIGARAAKAKEPSLRSV